MSVNWAGGFHPGAEGRDSPSPPLLLLGVAIAGLRHAFDNMSRTPTLGSFDGGKTTGIRIATDRKCLALCHGKPFFCFKRDR
jgi:hypothetical protein